MIIELYKELKKRFPQHIIFIKAGDFHETFDADAEKVSERTGITKTKREGVASVGVGPFDSYRVLEQVLRTDPIIICHDYSNNNGKYYYDAYSYFESFDSKHLMQGSIRRVVR